MLIPVVKNDNIQNKEEKNFIDELEKKIKENKAEVHTIDTSEIQTIERMSDEAVNILLNPSVYAFKEGLAELEKIQNNDELENKSTKQLEILNQMHMILLMENEQYNIKIIDLLPSLFGYLENYELYNAICAMLSDVAHFNDKVSIKLIESEIFSRLNYDNKVTFSFIFNLCDQNKKSWDAFQTYFKKEYSENSYIKMLLEQYK